MEPLIDSLNPAQKEAAVSVLNDVRVVAGAGSGKTRVLMARIEYLMEQVGIRPWRIMAITFTNKAAAQMRERLAKQVGEEEAAKVRISTIHSLCVRILREDAAAAGLPQSFAILDTDDQKAILRPFFKEHEIDREEMTPAGCLNYISDTKMQGISPKQAMEDAENDEFELRAEAYAFYEAEKDRMKACDFDDLLLRANKLLRTNEEVRNKWQKRLDYIHVDEFQDVDPVQYGIIKSLKGPDCFLCVVGDPDQTIYTWRGADVDIILHFDRDFPGCKTIILDQNYRSAQPILNAANTVIRNNRSRIEKDLFSEIQSDVPVVLQGFDDPERESRFVCRHIIELHEKGLPYSEIAVLYRANYLSRNFEKMLRLSSIPYRIYGGIRFYERQEIKDILSYLQLLCRPDPSDPENQVLNLAVERVINHPKRGIGARSVEKLSYAARMRGINMFDVMTEDIGLSAAAAKKIRSFHDMIMELRQERERNSLPDLIDIILASSGYREMLVNSHEEERLENIAELQNDIAQAVEQNPDLTLEEYLQNIALFTDRVHDEKLREDAVSLMTVHAAKGTEFDAVFLVSFNDEIFPSQRSLMESGPKALEEERRLLYVAMTRARKYLYITWSSAFSFAMKSALKPSRFLDEIPVDYVQEHSRPAAPAAAPRPAHRPGRRTAMRSAHYHPGDKVVHDAWGEGVVRSVDGDIATIAFGFSVGVKKIKASHPALKKAQ